MLEVTHEIFQKLMKYAHTSLQCALKYFLKMFLAHTRSTILERTLFEIVEMRHVIFQKLI